MANDRYENVLHPYFIELIKYGGFGLKKLQLIRCIGPERTSARQMNYYGAC